MNVEALAALLKVLNEHRVTSYESDGLSLTLQPSGPHTPADAQTRIPAVEQPDEDELLYWSAG